MVKVDYKKHIEELTNNWKRALADYANLEKRYQQERQEFLKYANGDLLLKLLIVLDNLEKALNHLKDKGLELAIGQFKTVLKEEGIVEINVLGTKFDPKLMECVEVVKGENEKILEVMQKGYFIKDKVLRPAKVKVGKCRPIKSEGGHNTPDVKSGYVKQNNEQNHRN